MSDTFLKLFTNFTSSSTYRAMQSRYGSDGPMLLIHLWLQIMSNDITNNPEGKATISVDFLMLELNKTEAEILAMLTQCVRIKRASSAPFWFEHDSETGTIIYTYKQVVERHGDYIALVKRMSDLAKKRWKDKENECVGNAHALRTDSVGNAHAMQLINKLIKKEEKEKEKEKKAEPKKNQTGTNALANAIRDEFAQTFYDKLGRDSQKEFRVWESLAEKINANETTFEAIPQILDAWTGEANWTFFRNSIGELIKKSNPPKSTRIFDNSDLDWRKEKADVNEVQAFFDNIRKNEPESTRIDSENHSYSEPQNKKKPKEEAIPLQNEPEFQEPQDDTAF